MRKQTIIGLMSAVLLLLSCQKENISVIPTDQFDDSTYLQLASIEDLEAFEKEQEGVIIQSRNNRFSETVIVPANSYNALQAAIERVGRFGRVILESGEHLEDQKIIIKHPVYLIGEKGARLTTNAPAQEGQGTVFPAIHITDTRQVVIWGIEMINQVEGGAAIIIEQSEKVVIAKCSMYNYQTGVIVEHGDKAMIWKNTIALTPKSLAFEFRVPYGIVVVNGDATKIVANKISNGVFGIWACDKNGEAFNNETFSNFIGMILCNVPPNDIALESGSIGSAVPATNWHVANNYTHDNFDAGILVIDGANNNLLINNKASNNGTYDIELTTDTERFGFLAPGSFENFVDAGEFDNISIKDCGQDNLVLGGQHVDTSLDVCF